MTDKELKKWKQRMPEEYRDCTKEEYDRLVSEVKKEFQALADNPDSTIEDILAYLDKNDKLLEMIHVTNALESELLMEKVPKTLLKRKKN